MRQALFEDIILPGSKQVIPAFIYGTAWKKQKTSELVYQALCHGFKGIDTAAQPKHYREDLVGDGIRKALKEGKVTRDELFIQTKFTSLQGQDPKNLPYDTKAGIVDQVHDSLRSSFHNLRPHHEFSSSKTTVLDSLVLHSPLPSMDETMKVWRTLESYVPHRIRHLGISNVDLPTLQCLYDSATVKPAVVQNRFTKHAEFDAEIREYCTAMSMVYQAFWTLTANPSIWKQNSMASLSKKIGISPEEAFYCQVLNLANTVILNGTTNVAHMSGDLAAIEKGRLWATKNVSEWQDHAFLIENLVAQDKT